MKKKILEYLEQLDLNEIEANLYVTLLDSGAISVRDLAELTNIKRTTAYFHIDALIEKGLVIKVVNGSRKQIAATDPETSLKYLVESRLATAKKAEESLPGILTTLNTSMPEFKKVTDSEIQYYKGKNGVRRIYEEALRSKELRSFLNFELIKKSLSNNEDLFVQALKENKNIKIFELFQDTPESREKINASQTINLHSDSYFYKFLPKGINLTAADILIYDDNVGIINVNNQFTGVVLKNVDFYNNLKEIFDLIWEISTPLKGKK